jgi:hypothetical protein
MGVDLLLLVQQRLLKQEMNIAMSEKKVFEWHEKLQQASVHYISLLLVIAAIGIAFYEPTHPRIF